MTKTDAIEELNTDDKIHDIRVKIARLDKRLLRIELDLAALSVKLNERK